MIIFGTSSSKIQSKKLQTGQCPYCKTENQLWTQGFRKYFHVFWIPFFPLWEKAFIVCDHCKGSFDKQELQNEKLISKLENFKNNELKTSWHLFTGLILISLLYIWITILSLFST